MAKSKMAKRNKLSKKRNTKKRNTKKRNTKKRNTKKRNNLMRGGEVAPFSCGGIGKRTNELHDSDVTEAGKIAQAWKDIGNSFCAAKSDSGSHVGNYYLYNGDILNSPSGGIARRRRQSHLHIFKDPSDDNKTCAINKNAFPHTGAEVAEMVTEQDDTIKNGIIDTIHTARSCV